MTGIGRFSRRFAAARAYFSLRSHSGSGSPRKEKRVIRSVKFIGIPVRDQDRALLFYTEKLGFGLVTDQQFDGKQRWIEVRPPKGDARVALFTPPGHEDRVGTFVNGSFECDNLRRTHQELCAVGVEFVSPPTEQPWGAYAIMKDSEGNQLVLSSG